MLSFWDFTLVINDNYSTIVIHRNYNFINLLSHTAACLNHFAHVTHLMLNSQGCVELLNIKKEETKFNLGILNSEEIILRKKIEKFLIILYYFSITFK